MRIRWRLGYGLADEVRVSSVVGYSGHFAVPSAPFAADAAARGPWHFDEGTGTGTDASSGANAVTLRGAVTWTTADRRAPSRRGTGLVRETRAWFGRAGRRAPIQLLCCHSPPDHNRFATAPIPRLGSAGRTLPDGVDTRLYVGEVGGRGAERGEHVTSG